MPGGNDWNAWLVINIKFDARGDGHLSPKITLCRCIMQGES